MENLTKHINAKENQNLKIPRNRNSCTKKQKRTTVNEQNKDVMNLS